MPNEASYMHKLGIPHLSREQMILEISERLRCARLWCQRHWSLICDPDLHRRSKFQLYKLFIRPILTYGCEVWTLNDRSIKRLLRFECSILLEIYKSKYPHRHPRRLRPNLRTVYGRYCDLDVIDHVRNERLGWNCLLKNEENALQRLNTRKKPRVQWWDQSVSRCKDIRNGENSKQTNETCLKCCKKTKFSKDTEYG